MRRSATYLRRPAFWVALFLPAVAGGEPTLHEYVPPPGEAQTWTPSRSAQLPDFLRIDDQVVPQPRATTRPSSSERVLGRGVTPDRVTRVAPDRTTTHDGVLKYKAEFNPSVVPFKRMAALDQVDLDYSLRVRDSTLRSVAVSNLPTPPDRDPFWGSLLLEVKRDQPTAIPSVAPEARILAYSTTPRAAVSFYRDSADNYWIKADSQTRIRLIFLTDAPKHYFSPQIPPTVTTAHVPPRLRPQLPARIKRTAQQVIQKIGLKRGDTLLRQLERLTGYFRSFQPGALPKVTDDTYLDIALSQRGVCRHRSFAFVVTAHALGIPARYVQNEAHAFTEVFVPRLGWVRIDLGGASRELQVESAEDKEIHRSGVDPFPHASPQIARRITGLRPDQRLDRGRRQSLSRFSGARSPRPDPGSAVEKRPAPSEESPTGEDPEAPARPPPPPEKLPTQISLQSNSKEVFRGEQVRVLGRLSHEGTGVTGLKVEVYLSRDGKIAEALLGATLSGVDGRFEATFAVPISMDVGDYQLLATTPGDSKYRASISR